MDNFQIGDLVSFPQHSAHFGLSGEGRIIGFNDDHVTINMTKIYEDRCGPLDKQDLQRNPVEWMVLKKTIRRVRPLSYIKIFHQELMKDNG